MHGPSLQSPLKIQPTTQNIPATPRKKPSENLPHTSQVIPVVRETAAQALAMAAQPLDNPSLLRLLGLLLSLRDHKSWHVRHGALVSRG